MRLRFRRFDWDNANLSHIARHGLTQAIVEGAVQRGLFVLTKQLRNGERRYTAVAARGKGRVLFVVYTLRFGACRITTAFPSTGKKARIYAQYFEDPTADS